jgi:hypothetical protein
VLTPTITYLGPAHSPEAAPPAQRPFANQRTHAGQAHDPRTVAQRAPTGSFSECPLTGSTRAASTLLTGSVTPSRSLTAPVSLARLLPGIVAMLLLAMLFVLRVRDAHQ